MGRLPAGHGDAAPVRGHPRGLRGLSARPGDGARPATVRQLRQQLCVERPRPVRRPVPQHRVPERPRGHDPLRPDHRAARRPRRRRPRRARRQVPAHDRRVPDRVLLHGRHLGRGRELDVVVPPATVGRRARQHGMVHEHLPVGEGPRLVAGSRHGPRSRWRSRASGRTSVSRSSSSPPACSRSPAICTRRPPSMAQAASAGSGRSPCRCSGRRCCSSWWSSSTRAFQAYGEIDILTGGGPQPENPTTTIPYFIYGQNSPIRNDVGLQAGAAVLLFLLLLALSGLQLAGIGRRVHYGD